MSKMRRLRLFQRDQYLSIDFQTRQAVILRRRILSDAPPELETESFQGNADEPLKLQLESFVQAIHTGSRPEVSGEDGAAALDVAHQILAAIAEHARRAG
jgi:predicted dehydrogenase